MMLFVLVAALGPGPEVARPHIYLSYGAMVAESDLVIIGVFASETPNGEPIDKDFKGMENLVEGVSTKLRVLCALKGDATIREVVVRHHRFRKEEMRGVFMGGMRDGPMLAEFKKRHDYMIFLKKRPDGRFECVTDRFHPAEAVKVVEPRESREIDPRTGEERP